MSLYTSAVGRLHRFYDEQSGETDGKPWRRRAFALDVKQSGDMPNLIVYCNLWNEHADLALGDGLQIDDFLKLAGRSQLTARGKLSINIEAIRGWADDRWVPILDPKAAAAP